MKKNRSKLIALLGILGLLVLLTTILISTYNERIPAQERERRNLTITPQILKQLQTRAVQLFNEKRYQDAERTLKQLLNLDRDILLELRLLCNVYYM
ncbi:MAG: hypothetical protein LBM70_01140 [Victivallales bacterium]|jgi:hypothetical protein|nr:hypothetical protein [Victivallales bacterium]